MDVRSDQKKPAPGQAVAPTVASAAASMAASASRPEPLTNPGPPIHRRHTVVVTVSADNIDSLRTALEAVGYHVQAGREKGDHEGNSNTYEWEYTEDPDMTHDDYLDQMRTWERGRDAKDARDMRDAQERREGR